MVDLGPTLGPGWRTIWSGTPVSVNRTTLYSVVAAGRPRQDASFMLRASAHRE